MDDNIIEQLGQSLQNREILLELAILFGSLLVISCSTKIYHLIQAGRIALTEQNLLDLFNINKIIFNKCNNT